MALNASFSNHTAADPLDGILPASTITIHWTVPLLVLAFTLLLYLLHQHTRHDPLAAYPSPPLASLTYLPKYFYTLRGQQTRWLHGLHVRYGPVVRFSPTEVSYTQPEAWKDIYGFPTTAEPGSGVAVKPIKDPIFYGPERGKVASIINADEEAHPRTRRLFSPAFSERALRGQEPIIRRYAEMLVENLRRRGEGVDFDLVLPLNYATFDTMSHLAFSAPMGLLANDAYTPWVASVFQRLRVLPWLRLGRTYPWLGWLLGTRLMPRRGREMKALNEAESAAMVDRRLEKEARGGGGGVLDDMWTLVLRAPEGKGLSRTEQETNAMLFMTAGTETTATAMSGLFSYLLRPSEQGRLRKLVEEVRALKEEDVNLTTLQGLVWLNACIEEGLRLYPPVPAGLPRVLPMPGNMVAGKWVPGKTSICMNQYSTYHSPLNFKDADAFRPERWVPGTREFRENEKGRLALQPFSVGPRNCLGKNLAYHEMRLILAIILRHFDFEAADPIEIESWVDQDVYMLWEKKPLMVKVKKVVGAT